MAVDAEMKNVGTIKGGIGSEKSGEEEKVKKKVKQGKKRIELIEKEELIKEKVEPEIDLEQMRGKEKEVIGEKIYKGKKTRKGKFEKEKKKGVHSCAQCSKEFKFPTLLAEVCSKDSLRIKSLLINQ